MITFLRDLIFRDFWLKLFSLALAILVWLTVSFAIQKEGSPISALGLPQQERTFSNVPVIPMSAAQDISRMKVRPSEVEVTVQGDAKTVLGLQASDIRLIVDLTGVEAGQNPRKRIEVSSLPGVTAVRVTPQEVQVIMPNQR